MWMCPQSSQAATWPPSADDKPHAGLGLSAREVLGGGPVTEMRTRGREGREGRGCGTLEPSMIDQSAEVVSGFQEGTQESLIGSEQIAESWIQERAKIKVAAVSRLRRDRAHERVPDPRRVGRSGRGQWLRSSRATPPSAHRSIDSVLTP